MPALDLRTLVLIYVGIRVGQALVLVYLWHVQRNYPPARDWAVGALLTAGGLLLFAQRELAPMWVSEILSNALLLPGWMIFDYGIVKATGREPPLKLGLTLCAVALGALVWHGIWVPNRAGVIFSHNLVLITFDLYAAYACLTAPKSCRTLTFRLIGLLLALLAATCLWRLLTGTLLTSELWAPTTPRLLWVTVAVIIFPMITMLLALQTSQRLQEEINEQARRDVLTGAFNRRAFEEFASREWALAERQGQPLSVLTVDLDHFKSINDRYGHQTGDATLTQISCAAQSALRASDVWCRYGGEEFVALLPNTTQEQATAIAERLRAAVEMSVIAIPAGTTTVTVSIGVAAGAPPNAHWRDVLATSDAALYRAKAAGRNRVIAGDGRMPAACATNVANETNATHG